MKSRPLIKMVCLVYPLVSASRTKPLKLHDWRMSDQSKLVARNSCNIANSNKLPGTKCRCLDGFSGRITWSGTTPQGECHPASCEHIIGSIGEGTGCRCLEGLTGEITWVGDAAKGECIVEAVGLFKGSGTFYFNNDFGEKDIKCCVSTAGKSTELQDLLALELPSRGKIKRPLGNKKGCGYMFGDTYHDGSRPHVDYLDNIMGGKLHRSREATCPVPVSVMMEVTKMNFFDTMEFLGVDLSNFGDHRNLKEYAMAF